MLWTVGEVVEYPGGEVVIHPRDLQLVSQEMDGVEGTGEIKEHDPHRAPSLLQVGEGPLQEVDDGVIHPDGRGILHS